MASSDGDAFRGIYTAKFKGHIYVLHCFKKKSHKGGKTPKPARELIIQRLRIADKEFRALDAQIQKNAKNKNNPK